MLTICVWDHIRIWVIYLFCFLLVRLFVEVWSLYEWFIWKLIWERWFYFVKPIFGIGCEIGFGLRFCPGVVNVIYWCVLLLLLLVYLSIWLCLHWASCCCCFFFSIFLGSWQGCHFADQYLKPSISKTGNRMNRMFLLKLFWCEWGFCCYAVVRND